MKEYIPADETGKTEAWVIVETGPESRIYAGLNPGTTGENLREAITTRDGGEVSSEL